MQATRPLPYDFDVVTRRVDGTLSETRRLVEASAAHSAELRVDAPFTAVGALRAWHTTGRLYAPGIRIARYTRVNLEITAWSADTTEVRLRPVTLSRFSTGASSANAGTSPSRTARSTSSVRMHVRHRVNASWAPTRARRSVARARS